MMTTGENRVSHKIAIVVPRVVVHQLNVYTGIPFMPHVAAHVAGVLDREGHQLQVFDAFGQEPHTRESTDKFMLTGARPESIIDQIDEDTDVCLLYCRTIAEFIAIKQFIKLINEKRPNIKICLFENSQAVTAFSVEHIADEFLDIGADAMIWDEPEERVDEVVRRLAADKSISDIPGTAENYKGEHRYNKDRPKKPNPTTLPWPAWDRFPLKGYWQANYSHGPRYHKKFLAILTSRGCPYKCKFCIVPYTSNRWRGRDAKDVVDEMEHWHKTLGVKEYHISDLNPTVNEKRIRAMCGEIIDRGLKVSWKIAQGTKIETIGTETLELMADAGCTYLSMSPETGSEEMSERINKRFDYEHGLEMLRTANRRGIRSQACLIAGLPGETEEDRRKTADYVKQMVDAGLDEIAVFGFSPIPGSNFGDSMDGYENYSECTFNPTWREDYDQVKAYRHMLYRTFFLRKLRKPGKVLREIWGIITKKFQTKMEMSIYKQFKLFMLRYVPFMYRNK